MSADAEQKLTERFGANTASIIFARRAEMLARFGHAAGRFIRHGAPPTPPEVLAEREATCRACPEWNASALNGTGRCRKCGCSTWAKLRMATERCPLGKWEVAPSR
jgi:hypothetical protein